MDQYFYLDMQIQAEIWNNMSKLNFFDTISKSILENKDIKFKNNDGAEEWTFMVSMNTRASNFLVSRYGDFFHSCIEPKNFSFEIDQKYAHYDIDLLDQENRERVKKNYEVSSQVLKGSGKSLKKLSSILGISGQNKEKFHLAQTKE